jgi:predicted RNA-binding protein YlxR (DUF448 family)
MKKIPQRTCMGCNEKKDKTDLIRVVKSSNGEINIDKSGKISGRGAYICDNIQCLEKAVKTKRIERVLETKIENTIYEKLRGVIIDKS